MGGDKVLSFEEVAQHNTNGDCWLIIHGKVYDVSKFMEEHPGGEDAMLNVTEKDASADFEEVGHSSDAQERMKDFCIGEIDELTLPSASAAPTPTTASSSIGTNSDSSSTFLLYILPLLILGVLFLLRIYSGNE